MPTLYILLLRSTNLLRKFEQIPGGLSLSCMSGRHRDARLSRCWSGVGITTGRLLKPRLTSAFSHASSSWARLGFQPAPSPRVYGLSVNA